MTVYNLMTPNPIYVSPYDQASYAVKLMLSRRLRHLLVVENQICIGILSETDIPQNINPQLQVMNVMSINPITIDSYEDVSIARQLMANLKIGCLPVTSNGLLIGILTRFDLNNKTLING